MSCCGPLQPQLPLSIQQDPFVSFLVRRLAWLQSALSPSADCVSCVLHGDLFLENCVFSHSSERLLGLIDFEEICIGPAPLDVAMTLVGCAFDADEQLNWPMTEAFLRAYTEVRPFSACECALFGPFLHYALLAIACWRFRQFNVRAPNEQRKNSHLPMQRRSELLEQPHNANTLAALLHSLPRPPQ